MPTRPKRLCSYPGCGAAVDGGRCPQHKGKGTVDAERPSRSVRGYDRAWYRFRAWFLQRHPVCEDCEELANEVHHLKPIAERPDLRLVEANCVALCKRCHSKRGAAGRGGSATMRPHAGKAQGGRHLLLPGVCRAVV